MDRRPTEWTAIAALHQRLLPVIALGGAGGVYWLRLRLTEPDYVSRICILSATALLFGFLQIRLLKALERQEELFSGSYREGYEAGFLLPPVTWAIMNLTCSIGWSVVGLTAVVGWRSGYVILLVTAGVIWGVRFRASRRRRLQVWGYARRERLWGRGAHLRRIARRAFERARREGPGVRRSTLDIAISAGVHALNDQNRGPRPIDLLNDLGTALRLRWDLGQRPSDLDDAIKWTEEALGAAKAGDAKSKVLFNLTGLYFERFEASGSPQDLERGVKRAEQALDFAPRDDRVAVLCSLSFGLSALWQFENPVGDIERAIQRAREAVDLADSTDLRLVTWNLLANRLAERWHAQGRPDDLDQAIVLAERILHGQPDSELRGSTLTNLAMYLTSRWLHGGTPGDREVAKAHAENAVKAAPTDRIRAGRLINLANLSSLRWEKEGVDELDEAEAAAAEALRLVPEGPGRDFFLRAVGDCLASRWRVRGERSDLDRAIATFEAALDVCAKIHRASHSLALGAAIAERWRLDGDPDDLSCAVGLLSESALSLSNAPSIRVGFAAAGPLCRLALQTGDWPLAAATADTVLSSAHRLVDSLSATVAGEQWLQPLQGVAQCGAYAMARLDKPEEAVRLIERGLGVLATAKLSLVQTSLDQAEHHHRDLVANYRVADSHVRRALRAAQDFDRDVSPTAAPPGGDEIAEAFASLAVARDALEACVGPLMPEASLPEILDLVRTSCTPVTWLAATPIGGLALVADDGGLSASWKGLEHLTEERVEVWAQRLRVPGGEGNDRLRGKVRLGRGGNGVRLGDEPPPEVVDRLLDELADALTPTGLLAGTAVVLVPTGELGSLPVHSAIIRARQLPVPVSVAVSALFHLQALRRLRAEPFPGVLAVTSPSPCHAPDGERPDLPGARLEGEFLVDRFGASHLAGIKATRPTVMESLKQPRAIWHFGSHGVSEPDRPLDSHILLADGPDGRAETVSIEDMATAGPARLVFLACCWLGRRGRMLPDEAQGFATALIQAGAAAVIAPLWPVNDTASSDLVRSFYALVEGGAELGEALALAQLTTREAHPDSTAWAAFTLTGAIGSLRIPISCGNHCGV